MSTSYEGLKDPGNRYFICQIGGCKERVKNAKRRWDGLLVCPRHWDPKPEHLKPKPPRLPDVINPALISPRGETTIAHIYTTDGVVSGSDTVLTGDTPSAPLKLRIFAIGTTTIELAWQAPQSTGSGSITGYEIERESPTGNGFITIVSNTLEGAGYYKDTNLTSSTEYNYRVSAINEHGTSSPSNEAAATTL